MALFRRLWMHAYAWAYMCSYICLVYVRVIVLHFACHHLMCTALIWLKLLLTIAVQDSKA